MIRIKRSPFPPRRGKLPYQNRPIMKTNRRSISDNTLVIPYQLEKLLETPWLRTHFYTAGFHLLHFETYRKFHHLLFLGGAGAIKCIAHDVASFVKKEMTQKESEPGKELQNLFYLSSNFNLSARNFDEDSLISTSHNLPLSRWFFITIGYLASTSNDTDQFIDQVIEIYLNANNNRIKKNGDIIINGDNNQVLSLLRSYFDTVGIKYDKLYSPNDKFITLNESAHEKIMLPPLPRIHNRHRLVKALMHCESYRALLKPKHDFAAKLIEKGFDLEPRNHSILKYELSFYDGLGDFFLASEASNLLYILHEQGKASSMRHNLYHVIKTVLSTNTLLSKIAAAYNLHQALDDPVMHQAIVSEYIPHLYRDTEYKNEKDIRVYEEEFLADYFEAYVGALYMEQPEVATAFVRDIYNNLVTTITKVLPPDVTYQTWSTNIVGRSVVPRN